MKLFTKYTSLILLLNIIIFSEIHAVGSLFSRPRWSNDVYQKMWIKNVAVNININDQLAVTSLDQTFYNELNQSVEAIFIFPLPENATITEMVYWVNGQRFVATIRERQEAIDAYNQKLHQWLDPALLEYLGDNLFRLKIVPINPLSEVRTEITYIEPLPYDFGKISYNLPLNTLGLSSKPLEKVTVDMDAKSNSKFKSFASVSHQNSSALNLNKISDSEYSLFYGDENYYPDKDLNVSFELDRSNIDFNILTYTPAVEDSIGSDSFYAIWVNPPFEVDDEQIIPQRIIFAADVSSSMEGERIDQLKEALTGFVNLLRPVDKFNIITFGTFVEKFQVDLVAADDDNKNLALEFISKLSALGLTNVSEALKESFAQTFDSQSYNDILFLTDGKPTWGQVEADSIYSMIAAENTDDVRIFSFGIGNEVSRPLLTEIANRNHGYPVFINSDDSISAITTEHFLRISKPVLSDIDLTLGGLNAWDIYPKNQQDLFWGSQQLYLGKYSGSGNFNVKLQGKLRDSDYLHEEQIYFPDTVGGHRFVPRLWARNKIDEIISLINTYGETQELVDQVVELSLRFQILTPYTAFYSDPDGDPTTNVDDKELPDEYLLKQNYPNPFNPETQIEYVLPQDAGVQKVTLKIYNSLGQLVRILVNDFQSPGIHNAVWNGRDNKGNMLSSGIYFYVLETGNIRLSKKMILLK